MQCIQSVEFKYDDVNYIIECDASYSNRYEKYVIAWSVLSAPMEKPLFEGKMVSEADTTVESELQSVYRSLREIEKITDLSTVGVIVRTDFKGLVDYLSSEGDDQLYQDIENVLNDTESWCIEKRSRNDISRVHDIANQG